MYIGVVYVTPCSADTIYSDVRSAISSVIAFLNEEDNILVLGDLSRPNIRSIVDENDNRLLPVNFLDFNLISAFYENDLQQVIPTSNRNGKWLDMIFTNFYDEIVVS